MLARRSATGRRAGKATGEGASSQKTCRPPRKPVPLEEGGNVLQRLLVVLGAALAAAILASPALAVGVNIRVEGARVTIWGKTNRIVEPVTGTFSPPQGPDVTVAEFFYRVQSTSFGPYVSRIGRRRAAGSSGWVFKVNHTSPPVGADTYQLQEGDDVIWYWATFGPSGGPKTLDLARGGRGCFRAFAYDDSGDRTRPKDVVFVRDGRRWIASESGRLCPAGEWETLRAVKEGMVRSEVVRS
jgi:hypothetical protein